MEGFMDIGAKFVLHIFALENELRALVAAWRTKAKADCDPAVGSGVDKCADELEATLNRLYRKPRGYPRSAKSESERMPGGS
jgi:hypothetical protein